MDPSVDSQRLGIFNSVENFFSQHLRLVRIAAAVVTTSSFVVALQISALSQIAAAAVLLASFLISKVWHEDYLRSLLASR